MLDDKLEISKHNFLTGKYSVANYQQYLVDSALHWRKLSDFVLFLGHPDFDCYWNLHPFYSPVKTDHSEFS